MGAATPQAPNRTDVPVDWSAIAGGTVIAAGVSFTLLAFGSAVGLAVASTSPTWRESSAWLWILSGLFLVFVSLCSFGAGGYATGRMRARTLAGESREGELRDGMHGLCTWGFSVLIAGFLALAGLALGSRLAAPSGGTSSVAGESLVASELDDLFRSYRALPDESMQYRRAEATRILLKSSSHEGVSAGDHDYLATIVRQRAGVSQSEAEDRVNRIVGEAKQDIHRARTAAVLQAFLIAAASLLGAAVAWFTAVEGARERERGAAPDWMWRTAPRS